MEVILKNRLRELRLKNGYSQKFMANYLGYSGVSGYSELERNHLNIDTAKAIKLSELFGEPVDKIFFTQ